MDISNGLSKGFIKGITKAGGKKDDFSDLFAAADSGEFKGADIQDPFERKPVGIFKYLDLLNRGQYAVLNPLRRLTDPNKSYTAGEVLGSSIKGLLGKERSQTSDVLSNLGWNPTTTGGKIARGAVGFVGDVLLDPLTYTGINGLTKIGKAAKAGAALKIGDAILDLRKGEDLAVATGQLAKAMTNAGKTAEEVKKATDVFSGIKKATLAKDMMEELGKYGIKSEAINLAKNWHKQFKTGQRALLQLETPRILGLGEHSTRLNLIGDKAEGKLFKSASNIGRRIKAGQSLSNEKLMSSLPDITPKQFLKAQEGNLLNVEGNIVDLTDSKTIRDSLNKVRDVMISGSISDYLDSNPGAKASEIAKYLRDVGFDAENVYRGAKYKQALEKMGKGWEPIGKTVSAVSNAFNFIPETIKKVRRASQGVANVQTNAIADEIISLLGKDGETLTKGIVDADDLTRRIEAATEGLTHNVAWKHLENLVKDKGWGKVTTNDIVSALDQMRVKNYTNSDFYKKAAEQFAEDFQVAKGLDDTTVDRMIQTVKQWNDPDAVSRVARAALRQQDASVLSGATSAGQVFRRQAEEAIGYSPHLLEDANAFTRESRFSHHGQTIYEANKGIRTKTSYENLLANRDRLFKGDSAGEPITGADILQGSSGNKNKALIDMFDAGEYSKRMKGASSEELAKINEEISSLIDKYSSAPKKANFSTDYMRNVMLRLKTTQGRLQNQLALQGVIESGVKVGEPGARIPLGYVNLKKVIPQGIAARLGESEATAQLLKDAANVYIPNEYVEPLLSLLDNSPEKAGAIKSIYDWSQSILKPFLLSAPATQMRNFFSSIGMAWAGGDFRTAKQFENFAKVGEFITSKMKRGGGLLFDIQGKEYSLLDLWDLFQKNGGNDMDVVVRDYLAKTGLEWNSKAAEKAKKFTNKATFLTNTAAKWTEETFRFTHFINRLQAGATVEDAIASTAKYFYDYGDLSKFESRVLRRVFPFYTFWRKNMEANVRYMLSNIGYANTPIKAANELTQMTAGEEGTFPLQWLENERQQWLANQGAFVVPWNKRIGTMQGILPQADLANILSPKDFMDTLVGNISPVFKLPYELATNKDTFTGREITTPLKPSVHFMGVNMPAKAVHALRPFRIIGAVDNIIKALEPERAKSFGANIREDSGDTTGERLRNAVHDVLGFRSYLQDPESVQLNKRMEIAKMIRRVNQYIESHPNLDKSFLDKLLRNKQVLEEELGATKSVGESDEALMKPKKKFKYKNTGSRKSASLLSR